MELPVFEGEHKIGTLRAEPDGLFYDFFCQVTQNGEQIRRVFVGYDWRAEYLGIPDASGKLQTRLPKNRLPDGVGFAVAAAIPRGEWLPWRGAVDGVPIAEGLIKPSEHGIDLLLPPQEAVKLPAWAEAMQKKTLFGRELMLLSLLPDGTLPKKITDRGEDTDETISCDPADDGLPADGISDDGVCDEGREADCADL